ncbi:hypothetical protein LCY76_23395 [Fictibacillus sp. KIGAM418]|uniref:Uncharacterized protein n=1 Tax=Fictibacillus marinisediminis TaxID=2878389 RepID=A0A9X1XGK2_9BACL|nr:hypothetical protein [Fictibacillus marinisediminis]MCK6259520.1 hypothetical protein [Fictibacillus marinisediminis]
MADTVARNLNSIKSLYHYLTTETEDEETGECYFYRNVFKKIKLDKKEETDSRRASKIHSLTLNEGEITDFVEFLKTEY